MATKMCTKCKIIKDTLEFSKRKRSRDGFFIWCKKCDNEHSKKYQKEHLEGARLRKKRWYKRHSVEQSLKSNNYNKEHRTEKTLYMREFCKKHPEETLLYRRNYNCMRAHGITLKQKEEMILNQDNKCLICEIDLRQLNTKKVHVDHDHKTNKIRGILCHYCNTALGFLEEDLEKVYKLAEYVKKYCKK